MVALRLLNTFKKHGAQVKKAIGTGLMFINATLNRKPIKSVMIDTGTTYNFVLEVKAKCLRLKLKKDVGRMKTVSSKVLATTGLDKEVRVKIGTWEGTTDLIAVRMDDFDVIVGMEFLARKGIIPIPSTGSLLIIDKKSAIVPTRLSNLLS